MFYWIPYCENILEFMKENLINGTKFLKFSIFPSCKGEIGSSTLHQDHHTWNMFAVLRSYSEQSLSPPLHENFPAVSLKGVWHTKHPLQKRLQLPQSPQRWELSAKKKKTIKCQICNLRQRVQKVSGSWSTFENRIIRWYHAPLKCTLHGWILSKSNLAALSQRWIYMTEGKIFAFTDDNVDMSWYLWTFQI